MNDVTLMKILKIANKKSHDLFQFFSGIHGKIIIVPLNKRNLWKYGARAGSFHTKSRPGKSTKVRETGPVKGLGCESSQKARISRHVNG